MFSGLLGAFVWVAANFAYLSYVRDGQRGFKRFAAFWLGFPITLVSGFVSPRAHRVHRVHRAERVQTSQESELEEEHKLLLEIRRDRALRDERARVSGRTDAAGE